VGFFSLLPFPVLYFLSDVLRYIFKYILSYRIDVIEKNIAYCFPDKSQREQKKIRDDFYKNFIDIILESIKGLSMDPQKLIKRYTFPNPELIDEHYRNGQHVITYSQHYNNWEWAPVCLGLQMKHKLTGVIKKLSNQRINEYVNQGRSGNNSSVVATQDTGEFFKTMHKQSDIIAIAFIADQIPYGKARTLEVPFLGNMVSFHHGAAIYAQRANFPIYSIDVHRKQRGQYEISVFCLKGINETLTAAEITARYAAHLEELVLKSPEAWLWSHKRFKQKLTY